MAESVCPCRAQQYNRWTDTTGRSHLRKKLNNIFEQSWNSIHRNPKNPNDTTPNDLVLHARAEDAFMPYKGRQIRFIYISKLGFERSLADTSHRKQSLADHLATDLHYTTRDWVIRNNLFVHDNTELNPYVVADNERYLRTLDFLQDVRILVKPVPGTDDSVDLLVVTKDVFSLKVTFDNSGLAALRTRVSDNNFLGAGQGVQVIGLMDGGRSPFFGYGAQYSKSNIGGSFVNVTVDYNNINAGRSIGLEEEQAYYIRLDRPLVSPYSHFAGALELSTNRSINSYRKPDSLFTHYSYNIYDVWAGYNIGVARLMKHDSTSRDRKFVSLRYMQQHFNTLPEIFSERYDPIYNDHQALLAQMTFFKQNFIKTQYIYGFGVTEDVPYGYNVSLTTGWWKQLALSRPYGGLSVDYYIAKPKGSFWQYYLRTGAFPHNGGLQDASILIGASYFSKVFFSGTDFKIRQNVRGTYTQIFNRTTMDPLRIDNDYGLRYFGSDSAFGDQRISLQLETEFILRYKFFGFRFAPFVNTDLALLRAANMPMEKSDLYPGLGGGVRARNESLVFETIELKAIWFPRPVPGGITPFQVKLSANLRYRYNTNYVHAPDIVQLNNADPYQ